MRARAPLLIAAVPLLIAAFAGCGGGTRACKDGTLFVTVKFGGSAAAADQVAVDVRVDGVMTMNATAVRDRNGTGDGTFELNFPHGYPAGKKIDVLVTAFANGTQIDSNTGTVTSLPAGCTTLTIPLGGGATGTGGAGGTGGGAAGRGGTTGTGGSTAGRGGTTGVGGTGGSTAGRGGTTGVGGSTAGRGGTTGVGGSTAGRGGTGGGGAGGTGGRGGSGGTGGASGGGTGGSTPPPPLCRYASFDSTAEGFGLNPYNTAGNLVFNEAGAPATVGWNGTEGNPIGPPAGSLRIDAPFNDYGQYLDLTRPFPTGGTQFWRGVTKLHARVKIASGLDHSSASPPAVQVYAVSYNQGTGGGSGFDTHYRGQYQDVSTGTAWTDYVVDLAPGSNDFDPAFISSIGVSIYSGNGTVGPIANPVKPTPAVIYVDSFWLEGACTPPAGTFPATSTCGASWSVTNDGFVTSPGASGCWHGYARAWGDPNSTVMPTNFSTCGAGCMLREYGTVGPANATNSYQGNASISINLGQDYGSGFPGTVTPVGSGLTVSFTNNSGAGTGLRAEIASGIQSWCYEIRTTGPVKIPYSMFNTACWDGSGTAYAKEPIDRFRLMTLGAPAQASLNTTLLSVTDTN